MGPNSTPSSNTRKPALLYELPILWAVASFLRLLPVLLTANIGIGLDDMFQYDDLAQNILAGQGYVWYGGIPTAFRPPLYPTFLALIYFFFGPSYLAARIVQALLGGTLPLLVFWIAGKIFADSRASRPAAWVMALYPMLLLYPLALATENLYVPLVSILILALFWAREGSGARRFLVPGFILGLAALTRSVISGFLPLLLFWLWQYTAGAASKRLKRIALVVLVFSALTLPWSIRNSLLFGEPIFIESSLGFDLYMGYHPKSQGTMNTEVALEILGEVRALERMNFQVEKDIHDLGLQKTLEFIRGEPGRLLYLMLSKISQLFRFDTRGAMYFYTNNFLGPLSVWFLILVAGLLIVPTALVLLLGAAGIVAAGWNAKTALLNFLILYYIGIHALILAEPRFFLTMIPFLAIYAAKGKYSLRDLFASPERRALVLALWALLFLNWGWEFWAEAERWRVILSPGGNVAGFSY